LACTSTFLKVAKSSTFDNTAQNSYSLHARFVILFVLYLFIAQSDKTQVILTVTVTQCIQSYILTAVFIN